MMQFGQKKQSHAQARKLGTTIAELPIGMWVIFVGFGFPLLILVTTTVRFALFWEAAREAADAACQAQYYIDPPNAANAQGTVSLATNAASTVANMFSGINIDTVNCYIVATPLANTSAVGGANSSQNSTIVGPNTALQSPADLSQNIYQVEVVVTGSVEPLVSMLAGPPIPGLNRPMPVTVSQLRIYENAQGLSLYGTSSGSSSSPVSPTPVSPDPSTNGSLGGPTANPTSG